MSRDNSYTRFASNCVHVKTVLHVENWKQFYQKFDFARHDVYAWYVHRLHTPDCIRTPQEGQGCSSPLHTSSAAYLQLFPISCTINLWDLNISWFIIQVHNNVKALISNKYRPHEIIFHFQINGTMIHFTQ